MWRLDGRTENVCDHQSDRMLVFRLVLWEGSKSSVPGVYDPVPGNSDKWLLIRYRYQGVQHQMFCHDEDAVKLPKTSHRVTEPS